MATTSTDELAVGAPVSAQPSLMSRILERLIEGREKAARRDVAEHLLALDDATLHEHGLDRGSLKDAAGRG